MPSWHRPIYDLASVFADHVQTAELESTRVYEPVIGIVTDNKDPSKLGRVKVKVPVLSEQDSTFWMPIIMLGAGKNRGWFFIPEPDDEVLVLFEHGDMDRPLVVGALWNGKDAPPAANPDPPADNAIRLIKSRAGSLVKFEDTAEPKIIIEDGDGKGRITFDTKNKKIIIEALEGDVCFQAPEDEIKIVAKQAEFKATEHLEIHAGSNMGWGTDASLKINGGSGVTMSGSTVNLNCGKASAPAMPTAEPKDVDDPYGS